MRSLYSFVFILLVIFYLSPVYSQQPNNSEYLQGSNGIGVILCHGRGKHPKWKVVDPLRKGINKKLGYHTLSIQLPNEDKNWKQYDEDFAEAYTRIEKALQFLRQEAGVEKVFLIGHSMGSRMASAYLAKNSNTGINGLVIAGCRNNGGQPFNCKQNVKDLNLPILDIWGGNNTKDQRAASERKGFQSKTYSQVEIAGANHKFEGYENEFLLSVSNWLWNL